MIRVLPAGRNELFIDWDIEGTSFNIYRSNSPNSGFDLLVAGLEASQYIDSTVNLYDVGRHYYYRVEAILNGQPQQSDEIGSIMYSQPDGVANAAIHEMQIALKMMNNPLVYVLIQRRHRDEACPDCYNPITKRKRYANCNKCNGKTAYSDYYPGIPTRISTDMTQSSVNPSVLDSDRIELTPVTGWIGNRPVVTPNDVIVDAMDRRYKIQSVMPRTRSQYLLRQIIQMVPLEPGHPAYAVPVDRSVMLR